MKRCRYEVHPKLVNFMVPTGRTPWHEDRIQELFGSLLGQETGAVEEGEQ